MAEIRDVAIEGISVEETTSGRCEDSLNLPTILSHQSPDQSSQLHCLSSKATTPSSPGGDSDVQARGRKRASWALMGTFDSSCHLCPVIENDRPSVRSSCRSSRSQCRTSLASNELQMRRLSVLRQGGCIDTEIKDSVLEQEHADAVATLKAALQPGDVSLDDLATADASLTFKNINYSVPFVNAKKEKSQMTILENCWGHFEAGSMVAMMGPSGCGKTTLLDILAKKKNGKYEGQVLLNGHEIDAMYPRLASYVPKEDHLPQHWKVCEAVTFDMMLRRHKPAGVPSENFKTFIDTVLEDVGLLHVRDSKVGGGGVQGLSVGQRRRVSLARGMARNPALLFCDDPTSGLSAVDCELVVVALATLSKRWNVTAVVVIHQCSNETAQLFDTLVLLAAGPGRIIYNGPMRDAGRHWQKLGIQIPSANVANHLVGVASSTSCETYVSFYEKNVLPAVMKRVEQIILEGGLTPLEMLERERQMMLQFGRLPKIRNTVCAKSFTMQVRYLLHRMFVLRSRESRTYMDFVQHVLLSLFIGILFYDVGTKQPLGLNQLPFVFVTLVHLAFCSQSQIGAVIDERRIVNIEISEALYGRSAYLLAQFIFFTLYAQAKNMLPFAILWSFAGMAWDVAAIAYLWLSLFTIQMDSILFMMAMLAPNSQAAGAVLTPMNLLLLLSGFVVNANSCPGFLQWLLRISPCNLVIQLLMRKLYHDSDGWKNLQWAFGFEDVSDSSCLLNLFIVTIGARAVQTMFSFRFHSFAR